MNMMNIETDIAKFMMTASKFEFFLVNENIELAKIISDKNLQKLVGVEWQRLAALVEAKHPFSSFDFENCSFSIFRETVPQYLVKSSKDGKPKWDSDDCKIDSWSKLLSRGYVQFRNNIAHGNKAQLSAAFTGDRTEEFMKASDKLICFIAEEIFKKRDWEMDIEFC